MDTCLNDLKLSYEGVQLPEVRKEVERSGKQVIYSGSLEIWVAIRECASLVGFYEKEWVLARIKLRRKESRIRDNFGSRYFPRKL